MGLTTIEINIFLLLFFAAAVHSVFLCTLLLIKSQRERGLAYLGVLMIPIALWLTNYLFYLTKLIESNPHLLGVFGPVLYLMGPLYLFFIHRSTRLAKGFRRFDLIHLLPAVYVLWEWTPIYGLSAEEKLAIIEQAYSSKQPGVLEILKGHRMILLLLGYVSAAYFYLTKKLIQDELNPRRIQWLMRFTLIFGAILISFIIFPFVFLKLEWANAAVVELLFVVILTVSIHVLAYIVLARDKVLPKLLLPAKAPKYATSPLRASEIAAKKQIIIRYLETEKPWKNSQFSIEDLAAAVNMSRHHVSQILGEGERKGFYDLISNYRIDEVKKRLNLPPKRNHYVNFQSTIENPTSFFFSIRSFMD